MLVVDAPLVETSSPARGPAVAERPTPRVAPWVPLAGTALLDRLRVTGRRRPSADPGRVAALHRRLGELHDLSEALGRPLVVTKDVVGDRPGGARSIRPATFGARAPGAGLACGALVHALFRQLVTVGRIEDAMADGLAALALDAVHRDLVAWIGDLPADARGELAAEVGRQAADLVARWPQLRPEWMPRTSLPIRAAVGGGVELSVRVDLAVGRPSPDVASVALVEVTSSVPTGRHRHERRFDALVETLRTGVPPFAVATYSTRTGELEVDAVDDDLLADTADRTVAAARAASAVGTAASTDGCRSAGNRLRAGDGRSGPEGWEPFPGGEPTVAEQGARHLPPEVRTVRQPGPGRPCRALPGSRRAA